MGNGSGDYGKGTRPMPRHVLYLAALLTCGALITDASANGRLVWNGAKWVSSTIAGGLLYDSIKPDGAEAAPAYSAPRNAPAYSPTAPAASNVCVVPGVGACELPYPIPMGAPCSCY